MNAAEMIFAQIDNIQINGNSSPFAQMIVASCHAGSVGQALDLGVCEIPSHGINLNNIAPGKGGTSIA